MNLRTCRGISCRVALAGHRVYGGGTLLTGGRLSVKTIGVVPTIVGLIACTAVLEPTTAHAQTADAPPPDLVDPDLKGVIGLGLIGAEIGFIVPALAGLHDTWAFIVFPA